MEPSEEAAIRKLPKEEVIYMTYSAVHDLRQDILPRVEKLEKWQTRVATAFTVVSGGLAFAFTHLRGIVVDFIKAGHHQ